ncbi:hypothetical protein K2173_010063 [Erythroxylum novogranatense]|uniref:Heparan-alpha-glucosaminide N-acetyltransferase catalytic domain-containing protein n=1 Tax=Erythroxylum novogranatense TaxID=1862640 RepID=A0AAV8SZV1_9ROSI|nr:hypothetical protein K2173_010063 [Erythroxylum novogranatense]
MSKEGPKATHYEPVKSYDEEAESERTSLRKVGESRRHEEEDVELALSFSDSGYNANLDRSRKLPVVKETKFLNHSSPHSNHHRHQQHHTGRLVSLDVFRGLAVALMILVDDAGGLLPMINHSPWNGLTLADVVMPFFLFIVGVSLALTYKKLSCKAIATRKALMRALKLLFLGLFLQGGFLHGLSDLTYGVDIERIRWTGILQRIAIAYLVAAACEIWLKGDDSDTSATSALKKYRLQWIMALVLVFLYLALLYGLYVPDWEFQLPIGESSSAPKILSVKCEVRGDTSPACNAVGMIDRVLLGTQHLYKSQFMHEQRFLNSPDYGPLPLNAPSWCEAPFDPEGLLSSVMAIVTCLVGLHYGHIVLHFKGHNDRICHWMIPSIFLILSGLFLDLFGMHINKALYTFSYMCVTAGVAGILFVGIYVLVDMYGYRRITLVLEWMGMHALMLYVLAACNILPVVLQGFYWKQPGNNILGLIGIGR